MDMGAISWEQQTEGQRLRDRGLGDLDTSPLVIVTSRNFMITARLVAATTNRIGQDDPGARRPTPLELSGMGLANGILSFLRHVARSLNEARRARPATAAACCPERIRAADDRQLPGA